MALIIPVGGLAFVGLTLYTTHAGCAGPRPRPSAQKSAPALAEAPAEDATRS